MYPCVKHKQISNNKWRWISGKKVTKVFHNVGDVKKKQIVKEYTHGVKAPHLGIKPPIFDNKMAYIVMNHLPGKELYQLITGGDIHQLSNNKKLELSYKLLLALRDQVIAAGVVHRDIKFENILVELEPEIIVNIIDYGLAKDQGVNDFKYPGDFLCFAPEVMRGEMHDIPCDIFSIARVISVLWVSNYSGHNCYDEFGKVDRNKAYSNSLNAAKNLQSNFIGSKRLLFILQLMLAPEPAKRIKINDAITLFETKFSSAIKKTKPLQSSSSSLSQSSSGSTLAENNSTCYESSVSEGKKRTLITNQVDERKKQKLIHKKNQQSFFSCAIKNTLSIYP